RHHRSSLFQQFSLWLYRFVRYFTILSPKTRKNQNDLTALSIFRGQIELRSQSIKKYESSRFQTAFFMNIIPIKRVLRSTHVAGIWVTQICQITANKRSILFAKVCKR
ncbi:MAG: hypothetical protein RSD19_03355, partial [Oscillospiraceae bacterium]